MRGLAIIAASVFGVGIGCASGSGPVDGPGLGGTAESSSGGSGTAPSASSNDSATSSTSRDTTYDSSAGAGCGNGDQDPGEDCDDGNEVDGDGCNRDCQLSGKLLWDDAISGGFGFIDEGMAVAAAADGTVFVAGYDSDAGDKHNAWLRRYTAAGSPLWTQTYAGSGGGNDEIRGLLLDTSGNLYATGYESTVDTGLDAWLRNYNLQGATVWTRTYNGPAGVTDVFNSTSFDSGGNLVVGGYHGVAGEGADVLLRKYTPDGDVLWTRTYSGGNGGNDLIWDVATSPAGHIYVAGYESGPAGEALNAWLAKYDTDGNVVWSRSYNGAASLDDYFVGVEVIGNDDVVVCGYETAVDYPWHSFVRRYDSNGMIVWTDLFAGVGGEGAHCFGIVADSEDNLVTTGGEIVAGIRGVLLRKYDAAGEVWWSQVIPGGDVGPDYGRRVAIGPGDVIVTSGTVNSGADERDLWVGVFTP